MARVKRTRRKSKGRSKSRSIKRSSKSIDYAEIGRKGGKAKKSRSYKYPDVPKSHNGIRKNCFMRRYSNPRHRYYVGKNPYYRSCGYDGRKKPQWRGFSAEKRSAFLKLIKQRGGITEMHPNYKTITRAYRRLRSG